MVLTVRMLIALPWIHFEGYSSRHTLRYNLAVHMYEIDEGLWISTSYAGKRSKNTEDSREKAMTAADERLVGEGWYLL